MSFHLGYGFMWGDSPFGVFCFYNLDTELEGIAE